MDKRAVLFKNLSDKANNEENDYYDNNLFEEIINVNDKDW